jgi:RNA polymerase sigma-70 factor (ECF subfamily)
VDRGDEFPPNFHQPEEKESVTPPVSLGVEGLLAADSSSAPAGEQDFQDQFDELSDGRPDLDTVAPHEESAWPFPQAAESPSPGEVLLSEFDALYHKYERRVYRQCYRILGSVEDAEDLTQEVFLQLFRKAHTFRGESSFSTWLHRLTINTVLMRLRRRRRWRDMVTSMDAAPGTEQGVSDILTMVSSLPAPAPSTLDKISIEAAIAQLSAGYKEIFLLHDQEGYRHDEIAKLLGITEGTSKSQLHKARQKLRGLMQSARGAALPENDARSRRNSRKKASRAPRTAELALV